jgi:hypothetical protein
VKRWDRIGGGGEGGGGGGGEEEEEEEEQQQQQQQQFGRMHFRRFLYAVNHELWILLQEVVPEVFAMGSVVSGYGAMVFFSNSLKPNPVNRTYA